MKIEFDEVAEGQVRATLTLKRVTGEYVRSYGVFAEDKETSEKQLLAWMKEEGKVPEDFE